MQACADSVPGQADQLLELLKCVTVEEAPVLAVLPVLASGALAHLASWAIQVTRHPNNLLVRRQQPHASRIDVKLCRSGVCCSRALVICANALYECLSPAR